MNPPQNRAQRSRAARTFATDAGVTLAALAAAVAVSATVSACGSKNRAGFVGPDDPTGDAGGGDDPGRRGLLALR
jgi:hypothetical protein